MYVWVDKGVVFGGVDQFFKYQGVLFAKEIKIKELI